MSLNEDSCLRLVSAVVMEISDEWQSSKAYLSLSDDELIDLKPTTVHSSSSSLSINQQCQLLGINRSGL
jgi:hypothetical protein